MNADQIPLVKLGPPLDSVKRAHVVELSCVLGRARNDLNPSSVLPYLAAGVEQHSQRVMQPIVGRDELTAYLKDRWAVLAKMKAVRDTGELSLGSVDLPEGQDYPCLIFEADGKRQALWVVKVDARNLISKISILDAIPPPSAARFVSSLRN